MNLTASVGEGGVNNPADVKLIQSMLQKNGFPYINNDGKINFQTIEAIKNYQSKFLAKADGVIDVKGKTFRKLVSGNTQGSPSTFPHENRHLDTGRLTVSMGQVTFDGEGSDNPYSGYFSRYIHWPGGKSGVTIGRGYDMGGRGREEIFFDLTRAGVPKDQAEIISHGAKYKGPAARQYVIKHRNEGGIITREAQARLFELIYPGYLRKGKHVYQIMTNKFPEHTPWENLKKPIQEIAIDFVYQGLSAERPMKACMYNDIEHLIDYITTTPGVKKYEKGRNRIGFLKRNS